MSRLVLDQLPRERYQGGDQFLKDSDGNFILLDQL